MGESGDREQPKLEELAVQRFSQLREAEKKLLRAAGMGRPAYCGPDGKGPDALENAPAQACTWETERHIRPDLIAWLCADGDANKFVHARGLTVACAKITGKLDLSALAVPFPLIFFQCYFSDEIGALYSDLLVLSLEGCVIRHVGNNAVAIMGDSLRARALNLRRTVVNGELNLRAAEIANNIECDGGRIVNPAGTALSLNAARVGGSVFLRNGFIAEGEVNLCGAVVGSLDCSKARLKNANARALAADDARIDRKADLSGVCVAGVVSFVAAEIGSDLAVDGANFTYATLRVQRAHIRGSLFARKTRFGRTGVMDLSGASAGGIDFDEDSKSWPDAEHVDFDGFIYGYLRNPGDALGRLDLLSRQALARPQESENQRVCAQPYRQLAKVLREMGYEKQARNTLIALEEERDRREHFSRPQRFLRWLYRTGLRYGYEPHKPATIIAVGLFLIGWALVGLGNRVGLMVAVSAPPHPSRAMYAQAAELSPMLYSLDVLLPIHAFHQEDL